MAKWSKWEKMPGWTSTEVLFDKKYRDQEDGGGAIARITINRPEVFNACAGVHFGLIARAVREANRDPSVGVIEITGTGDHFGTGGDVRWEAQGGLNPDSDVGGGGGGGGPNGAVRNSLKPVIAAVKGYCIGASNHLAYHCDFTIAADTTIFGQNGPRVGSPAHGEVVAMLAHVVGLKRAKEMWMLCRQYPAQQALEWGLANAVVPLEELENEVDRWADELLNLMPECLSVVKQSFEAVGSNLHAESERMVALICPDVHYTPNQKEAQAAFFERRVPQFWGEKKGVGVS